MSFLSAWNSAKDQYKKFDPVAAKEALSTRVNSGIDSAKDQYKKFDPVAAKEALSTRANSIVDYAKNKYLNNPSEDPKKEKFLNDFKFLNISIATDIWEKMKALDNHNMAEEKNYIYCNHLNDEISNCIVRYFVKIIDLVKNNLNSNDECKNQNTFMTSMLRYIQTLIVQPNNKYAPIENVGGKKRKTKKNRRKTRK